MLNMHTIADTGLGIQAKDGFSSITGYCKSHHSVALILHVFYHLSQVVKKTW